MLSEAGKAFLLSTPASESSTSFRPALSAPLPRFESGPKNILRPAIAMAHEMASAVDGTLAVVGCVAVSTRLHDVFIGTKRFPGRLEFTRASWNRLADDGMLSSAFRIRGKVGSREEWYHRHVTVR